MEERFLLDENVPVSIIEFLRRKGFQARRVTEAAGRGVSNGHVVDLAARSGEVILTLDSVFLIPRFNQTTKVIVVDVHPRTPPVVTQLLERYLEDCLSLLKTTKVVRVTKTGPILAENQ